ncbi:hypothetical protein Phum_PHUM266040 [Pediculus humanus corporis]|uniref:Uncharacterized protein n=1 Tax=Pediculus humanus subsp. corporis TaxID=121224 RepID=E0VKJ6_PEDHC|nr:uncharacterized protein Phum_PHUM266040 [Pediculus humanus corporis]EEB13902.1 hypothetical protein Phum_PHUM266040 [Pediculus humanus corporis]
MRFPNIRLISFRNRPIVDCEKKKYLKVRELTVLTWHERGSQHEVMRGIIQLDYNGRNQSPG